MLSDLKQRLARARFPDELEDAGWRYGTNEAYLKELITYWRDRFDWRQQERRLNQFEQFTTNIDGLNIHFIHRRSKERNALPLLITHGWPGSFVEFAKIIGPLTDPVQFGGRAGDAFDVVVPSVPGYGFSDRPKRSGYNAQAMAELFVKLMARLGYTRYGLQGGDIGTSWAATSTGFVRDLIGSLPRLLIRSKCFLEVNPSARTWCARSSSNSAVPTPPFAPVTSAVWPGCIASTR